MSDKPLIWLGSSRRDLRVFPAVTRRLAGFQLRRIQQGLDPDDWKPMPTVGLASGRFEFRSAVRTGCSTSRPVQRAVYVLHAFGKKAQKTPARDLETGRERFRALGKLKLHDGKKEERR